MGEEQPALVEPRKHHVEESLVVLLPRVQEDEVERARHLRDLLERVAGHHLDDVGEPGALDVVGELLRADRIVLDRDEPSARFAQPHARSRSRCSRWRRRSRARCFALFDATISRRNRPSSSDTASWPLSFALISARIFCTSGVCADSITHAATTPTSTDTTLCIELVITRHDQNGRNGKKGSNSIFLSRCIPYQKPAGDTRETRFLACCILRVTDHKKELLPFLQFLLPVFGSDPTMGLHWSAGAASCRIPHPGSPDPGLDTTARAAAAARPSATQSGIPTDRNPLPPTNSPRCDDRRCSIALTRSSCPTWCCAPARRHRADARQGGVSLDAENGCQFLRRYLDHLVVCQIDGSGIVRAAEERAEERRPGRRAILPFRRDPRARGDAEPVRPARHDEAAAAKRVRDDGRGQASAMLALDA